MGHVNAWFGRGIAYLLLRSIKFAAWVLLVDLLHVLDANGLAYDVAFKSDVYSVRWRLAVWILADKDVLCTDVWQRGSVFAFNLTAFSLRMAFELALCKGAVPMISILPLAVSPYGLLKKDLVSILAAEGSSTGLMMGLLASVGSLPWKTCLRLVSI